MQWFQALFLGILQGVAEFLPVSSSGHLFLSRQWMGLGDIPQLFDVLLHVASLLVILWIYRIRIGEIALALLSLFSRKERSEELRVSQRNDRILALFLILSTCVTLGVYQVLELLNISLLPWLTGAAFLFTGVFLLILRFIPQGEQKQVSGFQSLIIGIAQGFGTIPGISRSGITIGAASMLGITREKAGEYSFLLSIPAILGALLLDLKDGVELLESVSFSMLALAFVTTLVTGYFSLSLLLRLIKKGKFHYFSYYLIPLGILTLIFFR